MPKYPVHLLKLIESLRKLPGIGIKSAERFAFHLLSWKEDQLKEMGKLIAATSHSLDYCKECGCLIDNQASCPFCIPQRLQSCTICVVATSRDLFSIEETREYKGLYHVLGGVLSPIDGFGPAHLNIERLHRRIATLGIKEVIIALDSTIEGDATALYLKQELEQAAIEVTRLAFGLPMGSAFDYVDGGTLARAFSGRRDF